MKKFVFFGIAISVLLLAFLFFNFIVNNAGLDKSSGLQGLFSLPVKIPFLSNSNSCSSDSQCIKLNCPQIVGRNKPKCDLKTKICYCGGICGDGYCDTIEKRDNTCPKDCLKCLDGTPSGSCSKTIPKYCDNGRLVDRCSICKCLDGFLCIENGSCSIIIKKCSDGTPSGSCSKTIPKFCSDGNLMDNCNICGCPSGLTCQKNGSCVSDSNITEAYFKFKDGLHPETFIIKLNDPIKIQQARDILSGKELSKIHIMGKIVKKSEYYNPPWNYSLNSSSIEFFEMAIEECDAAIFWVEQNLDDFCGNKRPSCNWCPWNSQLIAEVKI